MADQKRVITIERCVVNGREGWRAELWERPYSGQMLASTRLVGTKAWAVRDALAIFKNRGRAHV